MTRRRFLAPPELFAPDGTTVSLSEDEARHLRHVLRLGRGDEVFVFDGEGLEFRCVVRESGGAATLDVAGEVEPARPESPLSLTLALALLKGEKFDLVVQKATELGVTRIIPLVTKHGDVRLKDERDASRRVARYRRIALEACKQSGRAFVPRVDAPTDFDSLVRPEPADALEWRVMFAERGGVSLVEAAGRLGPRPGAVTALVGSEGGWAGEEIEQAAAAGWDIVTLGGRTLRAETAAIAVTALLQHLFGDLA